jgi:acetyltransferase-like isoleucine patch superfamily enzyme
MIRAQGLRTILAALAVLLPRGMRRFVHTRLLGYDLHPTAVIGRALIDVGTLTMGPDSRIGTFVLIRGCDEVRLAEGATIHMLVWVNAVRSSSPYFPGRERRPALVMGEGALITMLHFIDACDLVELAEYACIAGYGTLVQTHAIDFDALAQSTAPVYIGDHSLIATRCLLLPGAEVPDKSIVAAGSVIGRRLEGHKVFAGVPAKPIRDVDPEAGFFVRRFSHVW